MERSEDWSVGGKERKIRLVHNVDARRREWAAQHVRPAEPELMATGTSHEMRRALIGLAK
jgi:hypothetical protein